MKIEIVHHYGTSDPDGVGGYTGVELFIDGNKIREYGNRNYGRATIQAEAFVEGVKWALFTIGGDTVQVRRIAAADREEWRLE